MTNDFHDGRLSRRRGVDGYRDEAHSQFVKGNSIRQWEEAKRTPQNQDDAPIVTIIKSGVGAKHEHHVTLVYEPMLHYYAGYMCDGNTRIQFPATSLAGSDLGGHGR
jgi:hypothetical protein